MLDPTLEAVPLVPSPFGRGVKKAVVTSIPARLDRLPWRRFHWLVVGALGITWILDGLEVTFIGAVSGVLQEPATLGLSSSEIGLLASFYLAGAIAGALVFGYLTDRFGRKRLFTVTLAVYLLGVLLSAFSWNLWSFAVFRFLTGAGIGGEYGAINSAVDELIPARLRGRVDLAINGSYWLGAALGAGATVVLLNPALLPVDLGWRIGFGAGAAIGLTVLLLRRFLPESPRWLVTHGYPERAEAVVASIERRCGASFTAPPAGTLTLYPRRHFGLRIVFRTLFGPYRARTMLGLALMIAQAFLYNAIFFTYALVLTHFYAVSPAAIGLYLLPFALGNFLGPLVLGPLFDTVGRRPMIAGTYTISALLLAATGALFAHGMLSATAQTAAWTIIFFFASAAASAAYLTVSEIFPLEIRALAIAVFYAVGTAAGGLLAPWLFGVLIGTGSRVAVFAGYLFAAVLMLAAAAVELKWGVRAEQHSLEAVAAPLSTQG
ncbi:MAG TPA: MFS transporter [Gammaproteobacteria bacterium]|nr:MFS transporter [Gammaproteobacteria bacterium]